MKAPESALARGFLWLGSAAAVVRLIDVGALLLCLTRVGNEDLGKASIAWTLAVILEAWNGGGVGTAVLNEKRLTRRALDTGFFLASGYGLGLTSIACLAAPLVAYVYGDPSLAPLVVVSGLKLAAVSLASVPLQRLHRALRFDTIAAVQMSSTLLAAVARVALAFSGAGAWTFVAAHTFHGFAQLGIVLLVAPYAPRVRFDRDVAKRLARFGAHVASADTVYQLYRNVDYLLIGHYLGLSALGMYRVVFDVAMEPIMAVGDVISRTAARVLCRIAPTDEALARTFSWTLSKLLLVLVPIALALALGFEHALALLGRDADADVFVVARVLVVAALVRAVQQLFLVLLTSTGRPELTLRYSVLTLVVLTGSTVVGLEVLGPASGLLTVAVCWLGTMVLVLAMLARVSSELGLLGAQDKTAEGSRT